jgi:hypothetical protein
MRARQGEVRNQRHGNKRRSSDFLTGGGRFAPLPQGGIDAPVYVICNNERENIERPSNMFVDNRATSDTARTSISMEARVTYQKTPCNLFCYLSWKIDTVQSHLYRTLPVWISRRGFCRRLYEFTTLIFF